VASSEEPQAANAIAVSSEPQRRGSTEVVRMAARMRWLHSSRKAWAAIGDKRHTIYSLTQIDVVGL
jgi:hypothetical protein